VIPGERDRLHSVGWEVRDAETLERVERSLNSAKVDFDSTKTSPEALIDRVRETGYGAELPKADAAVADTEAEREQGQAKEYRSLRAHAKASMTR